MAKEMIKNPPAGGKIEKVVEVVSKRRFVKVAPDKVRLASGLIKGKNVAQALGILNFSNLAAATPLTLTLKNAVAIAKDKDIETDNLQVSIIRVDEGPKLKRRRIIHQGRATAILKRMSHITVVLTINGKFKAQNSNLKIKSQKSKSKGSI